MRRILFPLLLLLVLVGAGCGGDASDRAGSQGTQAAGGFPVTLDTPAGKVEITQQPKRIVSLSPTATEMLFAVGAGRQVAAADDNSSYPEEAPRTKLSGFQPNVEAIAGYRPDLVVYSDDPGDLGSGLGKLGVHALQLPAAKTLDDTYAQIEQLGRATGHAAEAGQLTASMKADIQKIVGQARLERPLTYYHELDKNLFTATSKTFIGQLYAQLGLDNIADEADKDGSGYPQLSAEYVVKADPDLVFLADTKCCGQSARTVAARPGWDQVRAVEQRAVVELDDDIASRWGPRVVDFLKIVAAKLETVETVGS
jgi:iron complex transport system substrate-binding protein